LLLCSFSPLKRRNSKFLGFNVIGVASLQFYIVKEKFKAPTLLTQKVIIMKSDEKNWCESMLNKILGLKKDGSDSNTNDKETNKDA